MRSLTIQIPINTKLVSSNSIYAGTSHYKRRQYKDNISREVCPALLKYAKRDINRQVRLTWCFHVKSQKLFDASNYGYTAKIIEDLLVGVIIPNDNAKWVLASNILAPIRLNKWNPNECICKIEVDYE